MLGASQDHSLIWDDAQAIGVDLDLVEKGLGVRSRRYAMLVDDGTVRLFPADDLASCVVQTFPSRC